MQTVRGHGLGWIPDIPDIRDYHPEHKKIAPLLAKKTRMSSETKYGENKKSSTRLKMRVTKKPSGL